MKNLIFFLSLCTVSIEGCSQQSSTANAKVSEDKVVGGGCEGCEALYACPVAFEKLPWIDTLLHFNDAGQKLVSSSVIYKRKEKPPATNVVLYVYHTDQTGHYVNKYN